MAQQIIGTSRLAQRTAASVINANFAELYSSTGSGLTQIVQKTASYTLTSGDNNKVLRFTNSGNVVLTLPNNIPEGFTVAVIQAGAGTVTFTPASGATVYSRAGFTKTAGQHAIMSLLVSSNSSGTVAGYNLSGDGAA